MKPIWREDVVVAVGKPYAGERGEQAHRHDQDDGERQREALVERGEHQEDEEDRQR